MDIQIAWLKPIRLRLCKNENSIYSCAVRDLESIPRTAGIYVFARRFGRKVTPLYIGQAKNLRSRLDQQFNNARLMKGIENAAIGHKILMVGELVMKGGQKVLQVLNVVESGLIELAVANGHDLLNKLGKKTRVHVIRSSPGNLASRQVAPQVMHVRKK